MCEECGCLETNDISMNQNSGHIPKHNHIHIDDNTAIHTHMHESHTINVGMSILQKNNELALRNGEFFKAKGLFVVNIISSPGSGKTTLIEALAQYFNEKMVVIEGDIQTRRDSERVIRAGSRAVQIETGGACHLDAHTIAHTVEHFDFQGARLLIIENVGNLVCPATYNLGEDEKFALLSIPEGDDKVLKYPAIFSRINALIINKIDLADRIEFNIQNAINECKSLNQHFSTFQVSAKTGTGMDALIAYLAEKAHIG